MNVDTGKRLGGNAAIALVLLASLAVYALFPEHFYRAVQEDEYLEWGTFWAFLAAGIIYLRTAAENGFAPRSSWCLLALAAFCLFVAFEEISWGQRLLGYQPPEYFLERNYQQEFNLHNIVPDLFRTLAVVLITVGYGVVAPLALRYLKPLQPLRSAGVVVPPMYLVPGFAAIGVYYVFRPFRFYEEWVEFALALAFLFAACAANSSARRLFSQNWRSLTVLTAVLVVGWGSALAAQLLMAGEPGKVQTARVELAALRKDFVGGNADSRCGRHKRLYAFMREYDQPGLLEGHFAALTAKGLPESRAVYFLDPWNYAYWIWDICESQTGERTTFLYSFGPNQRRDAMSSDDVGDDIIVYIR